MKNAQLCALGVIVWSATTGFAQTTWLVPAQVPDIQAAISLASPGDVISVSVGHYPDFVLDKGITIIGTSRRTIVGGMDVQNIPAGQTASLSGLDSGLFHHAPSRGIRVTDCDGAVHLADVRLAAFGAGFAISNSGLVTLDRCQIGLGGLGVDALRVSSSFVRASGCSITGSDTRPLVIESSEVRMSASSIEYSGFSSAGASAIHHLSGNLVLGSGCEVSVASFGSVPAIAADGSLEIDPGALLLPAGAAPAITGSGSVTSVLAPSAVISEFSAMGNFAGRAIAPVGASCGILLGLPARPVPTPFGDFELSGFAVAIDAGIVPANGERAFSFAVNAAPLGFAVTIQALVNDGTQIVLSSSATSVLGF